MKDAIINFQSMSAFEALRKLMLAFGKEEIIKAIGEIQEDSEPRTFDTVLVGQFDAEVWVNEWLKVIEYNPSIPTDRGTMIGWFANAIMAGYDHAYQEMEPKEKEGTPPLDDPNVTGNSSEMTYKAPEYKDPTT